MRLLRIFVAMFVLSLKRTLTFRADLLFQILMTALSTIAALGVFALVYTRTSTLGGWTFGETIVLLGTYQIMSGLLATFVEPNLLWFAGQVTSGKLDDVLLKPVPSIFLISLGSCAPLALSQVVVGTVVIGLGLCEADSIVTSLSIVGWLVLLLAGAAITWASRVLIASVAL